MRKTALALSAVLAASLPGAAAGEEAGTPETAAMTCEHPPQPGRVICQVEARVEAAASIEWGDVTLVRVPAFASALRGRIGPHDALVREPRLWRWSFAVVARTRGTGEVEGRVRLVVCRNGSCAPRQIDVTGAIGVGPNG